MGQRHRERAHDLLNHLVLRGEDVGEIAIEALGPDVPAALGIDELRGDAHAVAGFADRAFEHEAHAQVAPDLLHFDRSSLVGKGGVAGDDEQRRDF
jgi:hypothetical protein